MLFITTEHTTGYEEDGWKRQERAERVRVEKFCVYPTRLIDPPSATHIENFQTLGSK